MKYIELFSGIGAFSLAIKQIDEDAECVFACDWNAKCADVYRNNFNMESLGDIKKVNPKDIPKHDLCFFSPPCQAFSKGGKQKGFGDDRGILIYDVFRILEYHKPKYILMENVRNLVSHDHGNTFAVIRSYLKNIGYRLPSNPIILSPHQFGIPQTRERAFLPGIYDPKNIDKPLNISFNDLFRKSDNDAYKIIIESFNDDKKLKLSKQEANILNKWDSFIKGVNKKTLGFPVRIDAFHLDDFNQKAIFGKTYPRKTIFIEKNKQLYIENKNFIDKWLNKDSILDSCVHTNRKFERQAGNKIESVWDGIIQFRPSGIRVKVPTTYPALVAMVHVPIIGKYKRRLSVAECKKLQSFPDDYKLDEYSFESYRQLGNSINVTVLKNVTLKLLNYKD